MENTCNLLSNYFPFVKGSLVKGLGYLQICTSKERESTTSPVPDIVEATALPVYFFLCRFCISRIHNHHHRSTEALYQNLFHARLLNSSMHQNRVSQSGAS